MTILLLFNQVHGLGAHTPEGRVTALSQHIPTASLPIVKFPQSTVHAVPRSSTPTSLPSVKNPSFFQDYFQNSSSSSSPLLSSSGYSSAHHQYQDERQRWSSMAYKIPASQGTGQIPLRALPKKEVRVLLQLSYQGLSGKVEKVTVS